MLPQIDVEDAPLPFPAGNGVHEVGNGTAGDGGAAGEGAEADGAGPGCKPLQFRGKWDIVPGGGHADVVLRYTGGVEPDVDGTGGECHAGEHCPES